MLGMGWATGRVLCTASKACAVLTGCRDRGCGCRQQHRFQRQLLLGDVRHADLNCTGTITILAIPLPPVLDLLVHLNLIPVLFDLYNNLYNCSREVRTREQRVRTPWNTIASKCITRPFEQDLTEAARRTSTPGWEYEQLAESATSAPLEVS